MSDEWRVSLALGNRSGVPRKIVERLRVRLGDDVAVSADKGNIFLYAGTEKAADEAEQAARQALALEGQVAESSRTERWDPDGQRWRDPRVEVPEDGQRSGGAKLVDGIFQIMSDIPPF
jgi:antitoxin component of MazEF toxin-antitoxin module